MDMNIELPVFYSQMSVFLSGMNDPYNEWLNHHVKQGFSYREGSISFIIPKSVKVINLVVERRNEMSDDGDCYTSIVVPFRVYGGKGVEIGNVFETVRYLVPDGEHGIALCLKRPSDGRASASIYFVQGVFSPQSAMIGGKRQSIDNYVMNANHA